MPLTDDERRSQIEQSRRNQISKLIKPLVDRFPPEEILHVLADQLTKRATIDPEVEVAQWILKLAERIDARGD